MLATTFALEPDFFERNCLARFLAVTSVDEDTGSADDIVARVELEERLREPTVTVLADRGAPAERSSLRWDVLHCLVPGGLLHSKVALLLWQHATRVIIGSANLTAAGYRHNIELAMAADLGETCILPRDVLHGIAAEIESYLDLVPGLEPDIPTRRHAVSTLGLFRSRVATQPPSRARLRAALAPTNNRTGPLSHLDEVWQGNAPLRATHVSAYWDEKSPAVLTQVAGLLTGRPAAQRRQCVAVTVGPGGEIPFPPSHKQYVNEVVQLGPLDDEPRVLHAKTLVVENNQFLAVLVGSSNHTEAGFGLHPRRRHRELNVWLGAALDSPEGQALAGLVPVGEPIVDTAAYEEPADEDEPEELAALPSFFGLCRLVCGDAGWELWLGLGDDPPDGDWSVRLPDGQGLLDRATWVAAGSPDMVVRPLVPDQLPFFLDVAWDAAKGTWAVVADDRHQLPPGPALSELASFHLIEALATGATTTQLLRQLRERVAVGQTGRIISDPLARFDAHSVLLRRGRKLAAALAGLERRLSEPVVTVDTLEARLTSPLGPRFIAEKVVTEHLASGTERAAALFTLAEVALSLGRVAWTETMRHIDKRAGLALVDEALKHLEELRLRIDGATGDLADYVARALQEAGRCIHS
ncbi:phospholipase D family protein [Dactylosporangium sp. CA-092794]|uniref:phospholipase D family protein n=1 Tax=Dactylosporangium sp. CA-092794 TaxID=3239929 RepID=UPI003D94AABF